MLQKNKDKLERKAKRQSFVGIRPAKFKKKTAYDRSTMKRETKEYM